MHLKTKFLELNKALCIRQSRMLNRLWPYPLAGRFWDSYVTKAAEMASNAAPPRIVDIGAGRTTPYAAAISNDSTFGVLGGCECW